MLFFNLMDASTSINMVGVPSWHNAQLGGAENYFDQGNCLFRSIYEGYCNSSLLISPNFLDFGGALAAFGLIFTVYQLRNPLWELVLRIRAPWQRHLFWIFGGIGLFLVLARVLMTQTPLVYLSYPFNIPLFYEVLAYLCFIASPISLLFFARRSRGLFNELNARKFYETLISGVSRSDDKWTDAALEILLHNLRDICKSIADDDKETEINQTARAIIDVVLSEESVVKILTTRRLDALQHIFFTIEEYHIDRSSCDIGIPAIVRNLFLDETSFFYKHLNRDGLALSSNIYQSIFESPELLTNFNFFGYPTLGYSAKKNNRISTQVFIQALSKAIATYLKTGQGSARYINNGLEYLSNTFGSICLKMSIEEEKTADFDIRYSLEEEWWTLHDIAQFLGHGYPFLDYHETFNQQTTEREKTATEPSFHSSSTINAGIAGALYKSFEHLSHIKKTTNIHLILHSLFEGMTYQENYKEGYKKPFEKRTWEQIGKNVLHKYYPAVLRVYLAYFSHYLSNKEIGTGTSWIVQQTERIRSLLYIDLKPLLDKKEIMVNEELMIDALLPENLDYKDGKFIYTSRFGKGPQHEVTEPATGAKSALEGVDLENHLSPL